MELTTRPIQKNDIPFLINYWMSADADFLKGMGADISKVPPREEWEKMLLNQIDTPLNKKNSYCIIWLLDQHPVGHSNVNKIIFGEEAYMHMHLWNHDSRQKEFGTRFVENTLHWFFLDLDLKTLYSEPYALNPAPNKTLQKLHFTFIKEYVTTPGWLNFEQSVKLWRLTAEDYNKNYEHRRVV